MIVTFGFYQFNMKKLNLIRPCKYAVTAYFILLSVSTFATKIKGIVTDQNGEQVISAYVRLLQNGVQKKVTITDFDGLYTLEAPEGEYVLRTTYMGQDTFEKVVNLKGALMEFNISMIEEKNVGAANTIVFKEKRETNTNYASVFKEKNSDGVIAVLGSEQMKATGVSNVSSAVKQMPGVSIEDNKFITVRGLGDRYTKGLLNGSSIPSPDAMKNSVQMDIFPSNIVDNIQVYKTFTPDLPGDFTGGLVDVTTRDFPIRKTLSVSVSGSFNRNGSFNNDFVTYEGGSLDFLGIDDGTRALPNEASSIPDRYETGNLDAAKSFKNNWNLQNKTPFLNTSISAAYGNQFIVGDSTKNKRLGLIAALSYSHVSNRIEDGFVGRWTVPSAGPNGSKELNPEKEFEFNKSEESARWTAIIGNTLKLNGKNKIGLNLLYSQNGTKNAMKLEGKWHDQESDIFVSQAQLFQERNFGNVQLNGSHTLINDVNLKMTWTSAYTIGRQSNPDNRYFQYEYNNLSNGERMYEMNTNYAEPTRLYQNMFENNFDNKIHFSLPFKFRNNDSKFKTGAAYANNSREFNESRYDFPDAKGTLLTESKGNLTDFFKHKKTVRIFFNIQSNIFYILQTYLCATSVCWHCNHTKLLMATIFFFSSKQNRSSCCRMNTQLLGWSIRFILIIINQIFFISCFVNRS